MQGIYEIVNLADGKASSYIGSSYDIGGRWRVHRHCLRHGTHVNVHLQRAWDKYGEDAFVFSVLEEVGDDMLLVMEQEYLDDYFDRGRCYNIARDAAAPMKGHNHSEETKQKMSEARRGDRSPSWGKHPSAETRNKMARAKAKPYPAFIHRDTGEVIPASMNLNAMCRERGLGQNHMWDVAHGKAISYKGWVLA